MENKIVEKCGEQFTLTTYYGITVIIDSDEFFQATKICKDNGQRFNDRLRLENSK